ncbi:MAG: FxsA family protein [Pseudomonadota bacterium]
MFAILLLLFIATPIAEFYVLFQVGDLIGVWPTIGAVLATAAIGATLVRLQGLQTLRRAQEELKSSKPPVAAAIHGAFLVMAGAMLLTPGFITDAFGFALLIPPVRIWIGRWIIARLKQSGSVTIVSSGGPSSRPPLQ